MDAAQLSAKQRAIAALPLSAKVFLSGQAGTGKTTAGVARLRHLVENGVPPEEICILLPQRTLAGPYYDLIRGFDFPAGGNPAVVTLSGLAQRLESLFWPAVAREAGFGRPDDPPTFLALEAAQYYLARIIRPLRAKGYFETLAVEPNRLLNQILDNMNKAAEVGFPISEIQERLESAWVGKPEQTRMYAEAQECAERFRQFCLENNLLDFSLQMEIFTRFLWPSELCREHLFSVYHHLIFENVEEDVPVVHDVVRQWLERFESALLIYDEGGGYRSFLGADPESGFNLQSACDETATFTDSFVTSPALEAFGKSLSAAVQRLDIPDSVRQARPAFTLLRQQFAPQMLNEVAGVTRDLIEQHQVQPGEIAILSPFLSDALRFSLMDRLAELGIAARSHRPSRSLRDEPAAQCVLTLARLAHPQWNLRCSHYDVRTCLMQSIQDLDLIRADVLARITYRANQPQRGLAPFAQIQPESQDRISFQVGERYERLREWLLAYQQREEVVELDIFLSRLFGEVLSQPGFGFHQNFEAASVISRLIESVQKFRWSAAETLGREKRVLGLEYLQMVAEGVLASQNLQAWQERNPNAVFIAPAYTFLLTNEAVRYQFWLDIGSPSWWTRLYQPLTHPIVLSRHWPPGRVWTDADEYETNQTALRQLTGGLARRCRDGIFLCSSAVNEQGEEPRGALLQAIQLLLRRTAGLEGENAFQA